MEKNIKHFLDRIWVRWFLALSSIFAIGWAIFEHYDTRNPNVRFEIVSEVRLFDGSEKVSSIHFFVDSLDVKEENLNVSIYTIRVVNNGRKHLGSADYEGKVFGISISNGKTLEKIYLNGASNGYIKEEFARHDTEIEDSLLLLPKVALDIDDWYEISITVLHVNGITPVLIPVGKLLGQKELSVCRSSQKDELPLWRQVLYGNIWAHLIRLVLGFIVVVAFFLLLMMTSDGIDSLKKKRKSRRLLDLINMSRHIPEFIKKDVMENGLAHIEFAEECMIAKDEEMNNEYKEAQGYVAKTENFATPSFEKYRYALIRYQNLIDAGYITVDENGQLSATNQVKESVLQISKWMKEYDIHPYSFRRV